ncbi:unnamed protein product [Rotaria socialis]|uniref:Ubiquitin carboxyl-terminal hydrolase MINDY n=1 Tax=Rotaria socialis TaxID=392032 RepID=A0A817RVU8_9BILA|nr:unnamed protein product [Rotaria socialis]CAF3261514.1 unnamed protein product [Rotaria socialis]CAF3486985.1 unnamed protein product [Rotaria socialis]CAF3536635.1 unnamed protein product [Rotaria socialis]CAF3811065.1 unnamed protein product [Rotaria socialis]
MVTNSNSSSQEMIKLPCELRKLVWGDNIEQSIFERWSQRFQFSNDEPSALIQYEGGPCSVLTTVQAHLLNELIFCKRCQYDWRQASSDEIDLHFLNALVSILHLLSPSNNKVYLANFHYEKQKDNLTVNQFHEEIKFNVCQSNIDLKEIVFSRLQMWKNSYGVLLFLYSCLMTKTIDLLKKEIDDETSLPLIDIAHGHGSQCLTNLLITGFATPHCFDGDKDISGLKLYGIHQQASIGFLSSLEIYRLMEVGWFLKNPKSPIWILGSETHLTVIFSREQALVEQDDETPLKKALKIFHKYDTERNGFISNSLLEQVITEIIESSIIKINQTINQLKLRMDPDNLQIITESSFLKELFPQDQYKLSNSTQIGPLNGKPFIIYHYNGLPRSNKDKKVLYASAQANISDYGYGNDTPISAVAPVQPGSYLPITGVLRTKWPTIELQWDDEAKPSLN